MSITRTAWKREQRFEQKWWDDCRNTFSEEAKQFTYARKMGLVPFNDGGRWPLILSGEASILDVGGGPVSMLLKVQDLRRGVVLEPCAYPDWTRARYESVGINVVQTPAEDYEPDELYDEAWCYNVLQHTRDPEAIVAMMRGTAKLIRMFEWIDFAPAPGHPHTLRAETLRAWLGGADSWGDWTDVSEVTWDLNVAAPQFGGRAFHGYVYTGL